MQFVWLTVVTIIGFLGNSTIWAGPVPDTVTYANARVLKNARGDLFYHDGRPLLVNGTSLKYPLWGGGKFLKVGDTFYYPDGTILFEPRASLYYPTFGGGRKALYNGYTWTYQDGQELASSNWQDAGIKHTNGQIAFDGKQLYTKDGVPTESLELYSPIGKFGFIQVPLRKAADGVDFRFTMALNPFHMSYIHPIVFSARNGLPMIGRDLTVKIAIETGYYGELLVATVGPEATTFELISQPTNPTPPFPFPYPQPPPFPPFPYPPGTGDGNPNPICHHFVLEGNHMPEYMGIDPIGFHRAPAR